MIETPTAIFDVPGHRRHPRVSVLVMGTNDLAEELRAAAVPGRAPCSPTWRRRCSRPREAGKAILDGVFNDVKDLEASPTSAAKASSWASTARR